MGWPAVSRLGLACIATVACWRGAAQDTTIDNRTQPAQRDLSAAYYCSIEDGGYEYPPFPCLIRRVDGQFMLAKLAGSQRFHGVVRPRGEGFTFDGEFYCPWGDCTQPLHGVFEPIGNGSLKGTFRDADLVVTLVPAPADRAWGGAGYGGDGYGGLGYGGWGYGGGTYGGLPLKPRSNRRP